MTAIKTEQIASDITQTVGSTPMVRLNKLTKGLEERTAEKEKRRKEAADLLGRPVSDDELLRYELAREQNFKCIYSGDAIDPKGVAANDTRYQVDHILPWSRFGDDSYINKTLCTTTANQNKRGRTPFEWFEADKIESEWIEYVARVEALKEIKGRKKRNYSLKNAADIEEKFKARNLTDTQWATRLHTLTDTWRFAGCRNRTCRRHPGSRRRARSAHLYPNPVPLAAPCVRRWRQRRRKTQKCASGKGRMDAGNHQAIRHRQGLRTAPAPMGCRAHLRLVRSKSTPRKGLRENHRKFLRMAHARLCPAHDPQARKPMISIKNIMSETLRADPRSC